MIAIERIVDRRSWLRDIGRCDKVATKSKVSQRRKQKNKGQIDKIHTVAYK